MKKLFLIVLLAVAAATAPAATTNLSPWGPLFQGIDYASARVLATLGGEKNAAVSCLRIDLADPDIKLFGTPHCTNGCALDTLAESTSHFLEDYAVQVAVNCNFYSSGLGPNDSPLGTPDEVLGLAISQGLVVSPAANTPQAIALLFTTNNTPTFIPRNWPAASTAGVYTAIGGNILLLTNGVNVGTNVLDNDPRTAVGLSQDKRYLYLMTVDGRQNGWSDGMNFYETADWLARFGAFNGMNVDGGGSTTMCMADCQGKSIRLNRPSFVAQYGRERNIGHNFGVYARPLSSEIKDLAIEPGTTTAILAWKTRLPSTTQVEYGLTTNFGGATPLDPRAVTAHIATVSGLLPGSNYYFRVLSLDGFETYSLGCQFATTTAVSRALAFNLNKTWRYTTNNLDAAGWKALDFDDSGWMGPGAGLLYVESNVNVSPRNTALPLAGVASVFRTYYFRTHFNFIGATAGLTLTLSNYIDDGAVFHLNGAELYRLRVPAAPTSILNSTAASGQPCSGTVQQGDAASICPDVFTVSGNVLTNLVQGDNVLAVEVHNFGASADLVFGSALILNRTGAVAPKLYISMTDGEATFYWNGAGYTLQRSSDLSSPNNWLDVPGPITASPSVISNAGTMFFRLRP